MKAAIIRRSPVVMKMIVSKFAKSGNPQMPLWQNQVSIRRSEIPYKATARPITNVITHNSFKSYLWQRI
jgi:hypothetical protein